MDVAGDEADLRRTVAGRRNDSIARVLSPSRATAPVATMPGSGTGRRRLRPVPDGLLSRLLVPAAGGARRDATCGAPRKALAGLVVRERLAYLPSAAGPGEAL